MISFKEFCNEAKQIGVVYYFTTYETLVQILMQNANTFKFNVFSNNGKTISLTRNQNLPNYNGGHLSAFKTRRVRVALDGNKISNKYRVRPIAGLIDDEPDVEDLKHNEYRVNRNSGESEEAMFYNGESVDLSPYILQIDILRHRSTDSHFRSDIEPYFKSHEVKYFYGKILPQLREWDDYDPIQSFDVEFV
jgi:hypothetical protein